MLGAGLCLVATSKLDLSFRSVLSMSQCNANPVRIHKPSHSETTAIGGLPYVGESGPSNGLAVRRRIKMTREPSDSSRHL